MGDLKRAFITWAGEVREVKEADKCRRVLFLMDSLNVAVRENVALVFDQRDNRIREKALTKMIGNHQNLLRDAFNKWRKDTQIANILKQLDDDKKKTLIDGLSKIFLNSTQARLRLILSKFHENAKVGSVRDRFFKRILSTKAGAYITSF